MRRSTDVSRCERGTDGTGLALACALLLVLGGCASAPPGNKAEAPAATQATAAGGQANTPVGGQANTPAGGQAGTPAAKSGGAPGQGPAAAAVIPARATADFERAVGYMRSGNAVEAELEFKQMTLAYPSLSAPYVNLGILYRKGGRLDQSEEALKTAVERNDASAVAWNELGATQRLRGKFPDAAASYERAIAADANYAPAYRNLGVVSDLYLGDPERALTALERYKELTGEDRPVTSWIAELRQRTGKPPLKPRSATPAPEAAGSAAATPAPSDSSAPSTAPPTSVPPASSSPPAAAPAPPPPASPPKAGE